MPKKAGVRAVGAMVGAVIALAVLIFASVAVAGKPTGDYAIFRQCPRFTTGVVLCLYAETTSGSVTLGNATVPINADKQHPLILQGGIEQTEGIDNIFVNALNGETLSRTPQAVPGGLFGLIGCSEIKGRRWVEREFRLSCKLMFESAITRVNVVTELAGEVGINVANLEISQGPAFTLPVKVKLENPLLGNRCYIGSDANPIMLGLTAGTTEPSPPNQPIKGKAGYLNFKDEFNFIEITEDTLVNNEFSAPAATGCGGAFSFLVDPIIDARLGLPSADGHNTVIQNNTIYAAGAGAVIKSER